jgi:hypothetical protein
MNSSILIIDSDNCYIYDDYNEFDEYKYLGPVVYYQYFRFWLNNKYETVYSFKKNMYVNSFPKNMYMPAKELKEKKIRIIDKDSYDDDIPDDTEIIIVNSFFHGVLGRKLPTGLKILCCLNLIYANSHGYDLDLPIGLKYLCLNQVLNNKEIINKIKIPFGCKIIFFNC